MPHEDDPDDGRGRAHRHFSPAGTRRKVPTSAVRHQADPRPASRRDVRARGPLQTFGHAQGHEGRGCRGAFRRAVRRARLGPHSLRQHHRFLQHPGSGSQERGQAIPGRDLESRGRLLSLRPDHRPPRLSQARQPLRRVQGLQRGARQPVRRPLRHADVLHAHRQRESCADRPAPARHLDQRARHGPACHDRHRTSGPALRDRLWHIRQRPRLVR